MADQRVPTVRTLVTLPTYLDAVVRAWHVVGDAPCTRVAAAVLWAQYSIETGGRHCYGWNIGNVKQSPGDGFDYHCLRGVWEGVSPAQAARLIAKGEALADPSDDHRKAVGAGSVPVVFEPPHPATRFRAYPSLTSAMEHHLVLLATKRYAGAWPCVLNGDYAGFAANLKARGYFTASAEAYANGMRGAFDFARTSTAFDNAVHKLRLEQIAAAERVVPPLPEGTRIIHPWLFNGPDEADDDDV